MKYINPELLKEEDFENVTKYFNETKGLIIDLRNFPNIPMMYTYGNWLKPSSSCFAKYYTVCLDMPGAFKVNISKPNGGNSNNPYRGKIVILVDERTQSQAEYTVMALSTAPRAIVIGDTTAGADGNISEMALPGGIIALFSGIGIMYPDGRETQKLGVKIDRFVRPTIKGIVAGKDEALDAAISILEK